MTPTESTRAFDGTLLPAGDDKTRQVRAMFDAIAPRYDLVNRIMSLGLDLRWRRAAVRSLALPGGATVLDLASGTGDFLRILRQAGLRPFGVDLSWGMLAADQAGSPRVQADAAALPVADGSVGGATCGYALRNFTDLAGALVELGRVVRPGGRIALVEVAEPRSRLLLAGYRLWFRRLVPLIGGLLSDRGAYRYLPRSTAYLPPARELRALLLDAGFSGVNIRPLSGGLSQLITATRSASGAR
ncbi:MAG: ubiquinone/menaquinone biosynthesis methyltransferase [Actinomycetota bacterium]|jgi:demethylmenaquinone methyltransferase/2-methoxy-6-polyprenyl-1,4-benzoquinol methylase|nr:ubiquinone/menaquinone biosynthesis methyltransferase [Actinomycetota bacterium]